MSSSFFFVVSLLLLPWLVQRKGLLVRRTIASESAESGVIITLLAIL
jgi:hypothetical protein